MRSKELQVSTRVALNRQMGDSHRRNNDDDGHDTFDTFHIAL